MKYYSNIGEPFLLFLVVFVEMLMNGWAISTLWEWFWMPTFGLPFISIPQAIGLSLLVSCMRTVQRPQENDKDFYENVSYALGAAIGPPVFSVLLGKIILSFV